MRNKYFSKGHLSSSRRSVNTVKFIHQHNENKECTFWGKIYAS